MRSHFHTLIKKLVYYVRTKVSASKNVEVVTKNCSIDVPPHSLTSTWIVMTNARVFHNNEIHNNEM